MKQPIIKFALVAFLTGSAVTMNAQDKSIRLDPVRENTYRLTYKYSGASRIQVDVEVIDPAGRVLFADHLDQKKSFTKPYTLENLTGGVFTFKVIDKDGEYVRLIDLNETSTMNATIETIDKERAKVVVRGGCAPVHVKVLDRSGVMVFDDLVQTDSGFSRLYDLSNVIRIASKIEVSTGTSVLASANIQ